jgi:hypothetical protein
VVLQRGEKSRERDRDRQRDWLVSAGKATSDYVSSSLGAYGDDDRRTSPVQKRREDRRQTARTERTKIAKIW